MSSSCSSDWLSRRRRSRSWLRGSRAFLAAVVTASGAFAQTTALHVSPNGYVGIGTQTPQGNLHIFGGANMDIFNGLGPDLSTGPAFNFGYGGNTWASSSVGFFNVRPHASAVAANPSLRFMTKNMERMMVDDQGSIGVHMSGVINDFNPAHPIHAQTSGAYLSGLGVWTNSSSRALKENILPLGLEAALSAPGELQRVEFNYRADPSDPQVGFIAEDVPALVATPDRTGLAPMDIVAVLTAVVKAQQETLAAQAEQLERQQQELTRLSARFGLN
jgi:hypothetical protein